MKWVKSMHKINWVVWQEKDVVCVSNNARKVACEKWVAMCQWQGYVGGRVQRNGGRVVCIIEELSMHYEMRTREAQVLACKNIPYAK